MFRKTFEELKRDAYHLWNDTQGSVFDKALELLHTYGNHSRSKHADAIKNIISIYYDDQKRRKKNCHPAICHVSYLLFQISLVIEEQAINQQANHAATFEIIKSHTKMDIYKFYQHPADIFFTAIQYQDGETIKYLLENNKLDLKKRYPFQDAESKQLMTPLQAAFVAASMTADFNMEILFWILSHAIMKDRGCLNIPDSAGKYVDDYFNRLEEAKTSSKQTYRLGQISEMLDAEYHFNKIFLFISAACHDNFSTILFSLPREVIFLISALALKTSFKIEKNAPFHLLVRLLGDYCGLGLIKLCISV